MIQLLPCPFCGSTARPLEDPDGLWTSTLTGCSRDKKEKCPIGYETMTPEQWNTRASIPAALLDERNLKTHPWNKYAP